MRRGLSIAKATALEILSEPLSLLLLLTALAISTLAPAFHYHQFGEPSRMARDAGLSALFTCATVFAVAGAIKTIRSEIESGTIQMALARSVSRRTFFLSKVLGVFFAYCAFALIVVATSLTIVFGAEAGGRLAAKTGDVARLWGPALAAGVGMAIVPLAVGAFMNRIANCRFALTVFRSAIVFSFVLLGLVGWLDGAMAARLLPASVLIMAYSAMFLAAAAALAVKMKAGAASAAVGALAMVSLPMVGNYYLSDQLRGGGTIPWFYTASAVAAALFAIAAFLVLGIHFLSERDIS